MTALLRLPVLLLALVGGAACAQAPGRGQLLYDTHCIACHSAKMHWRDGRLVTDWATLEAQVRRWQATARLNWSDADIGEVARHLNQRYYKLPAPKVAWAR